MKDKNEIKSIFGDRKRTNLLWKQEQKLIIWLVKRIPVFITPNFMTGLGFFGYLLVTSSFIIAVRYNRAFLLLGLLGFSINWMGDSLDGRLAFYRNKPRKYYGFTLDITIDWISIVFVALGYIIYADGLWKLLGFGFVVMYGWEMILALIRYKITGKYTIDCGFLGPTEARIIIASIMAIEVLFPGSLSYSVALVVFILFIVNIADTKKLLSIADHIDKKEMQEN